MNKKYVILMILLVMVILIIGCKVKNPPAGASTDEKLPNGQMFVAIQNPERVTHNSFSIVKPKEWREVQYASNIIVYLPSGSDINNPFAEKYSMIVGFLPENNTASLKELTDIDIAKMKETMPALDVLGDYENARLGQLDGLQIRFSIRVQNKTIESTQLRTIQGRVFYAFSQQCLQGECLAEHTDIFYDMARSFEWKNPQ